MAFSQNHKPRFFLPDTTHEPYPPSATITVNFNSVLLSDMSLATTSLITAASAHVSITSMIAIVVEVTGGVGTGIVATG